MLRKEVIKLLKYLKEETNMSQTANGAVAYLSTYDGVLDFFSQAGAMRDWNCYDHVELFERAWIADRELALKALFYLRDVRGGQGERKVFRTLFKWLVDNYESEVEQMIKYIPEGGSWKDVAYFLQVSSRDYEYGDSARSYIGFRTVQDYMGTQVTGGRN